MILSLILLSLSAHAEPHRFVLQADKTYTVKEKAQLVEIEQKLGELSNSACFKAWFSEKKRKQLVQTNGKTRAEVVKHLATATAFARVTMYYTSKNVIGYRNKGSNLIHTNSKYHRAKGFGLCSKASNLFHEVSHVMGYTHDFERTKRRPYSVPYTISAAVNACCKE
jgi:hypothetical protein